MQLDHANRARAAVAALTLEAPYERRVARLQAGPFGRLGAQREARQMIRRADVTHARWPVLGLRGRQRGVRRGEDDALRERLVDLRIGRRVAWVAHEGDAVDLGGDRLLQLGDHQVRIPVGEVVGDRRSKIELGLLVAVVDVIGEDAALRAARESGDLDARAPFGDGVRRVSCRGAADDKSESRRRAKDVANVRFTHICLPHPYRVFSTAASRARDIETAPRIAAPFVWCSSGPPPQARRGHERLERRRSAPVGNSSQGNSGGVAGPSRQTKWVKL